MAHNCFVGRKHTLPHAHAWGYILAPLSGCRRLVEQAQHVFRANLWVQTITAFAVGLLLCGCSAKKEPEGEPVVTVDVAPVLNSAIQLKVNADAVLYPMQQAAIVPKIAAPVKNSTQTGALMCGPASCSRSLKIRISQAQLRKA